MIHVTWSFNRILNSTAMEQKPEGRNHYLPIRRHVASSMLETACQATGGALWVPASCSGLLPIQIKKSQGCWLGRRITSSPQPQAAVASETAWMFESSEHPPRRRDAQTAHSPEREFRAPISSATLFSPSHLHTSKPSITEYFTGVTGLSRIRGKLAEMSTPLRLALGHCCFSPAHEAPITARHAYNNGHPQSTDDRFRLRVRRGVKAAHTSTPRINCTPSAPSAFFNILPSSSDYAPFSTLPIPIFA